MPILSIQSHVCFGSVGNRAASFLLQRLGFEVWAVNTVQFSNHTGYGTWTGETAAPEMVAHLIEGVLARATPGSCQAVLSGYLGDAALGEAILAAVTRLRKETPDLLYGCDPVMGDRGRGLFVHPAIPTFLTEQAVPAADLLTPNLFELELLTGRTVRTLAEVVAAARSLTAKGPRLVLVTSLRHQASAAHEIEMLAVTPESAWRIATPYLTLEPPPGGLGDATAALFLAHYLKSGDPRRALEACAAAVYEIAQATAARGGRDLALVEVQDLVVKPRRQFTAEAVAQTAA
ncbi:pyridoxal kinase PdxY [Algihabitans albus]|uniref:pyridoxal kinase PdxY n=1 Tax=Algihabitans albus TaxID=2164067 RepID=UPI000E5D35E0|nr:pyridoxal kinase PdxY [Algihabitans albus]